MHASQVLRTQMSQIREDGCHILTVLAIITLSHKFHCVPCHKLYADGFKEKKGGDANGKKITL